ncbi:MAG: dCTP deaminase [Candidatus Nanohalarchaeota archaeon]|nr:MAG: dCTP deaminase [Candidatus Nanohaloarchaeota archaeon]
MVLSDRDIKERLKKGELIIKGIDLDVQVGPSSVDLRLGSRFRMFKMSDHSMIDPADYHDELIKKWDDGQTEIEECTYTRLYVSTKPFILHPSEFVLASLKEYISIPDDLVGRLEGRSSLGRLGLMVHSTAGYVDPGFSGHLTLELANVGKLPVKLYPGMRICQIVFQDMTSPAEVPYGEKEGSKYQDECGATQSRINVDADIK